MENANMNTQTDLKSQEPVYVTGHRHPDSDSIVSAIAYSFFKRAQGVRAVPCRLGDISNETRYLLNRFGFEEPELLEDARKTLKEIELDPPESIRPDTTVYEAIQHMKELDRPSFAVTDEENRVVGYVSRSDLAEIGLGDTAMGIELLRHTSAEDIAKTLNGTILYSDPDLHLNGKVSIVALSEGGVANYEVKDRIVILGNDSEAEKQLIEQGAGMLIVVWAKGVDGDVLRTAEEHHCPVIISGHGTMNTSRYLFFAPRVELIMKRKPAVFNENEFAEDAGHKMARTRFRAYPVTDDENRLIGYVGRSHIMSYKNKKIILVDHNEFSQSVKAVEKAQILEVVDHHRINDFATSQPVSFRNEIVGSSATIIATMFRENQIPIPSNLAGLMLGALLSDTLLFQSPTTTPKDISTAHLLAALANLDIETFGKEMFSKSSENTKLSIQEMIVQDIKYYDIDGCKTMISQCMVSSVRSLIGKENEIQACLDKLVHKKNLDLVVAAFTSVADEGSVFYGAGDKKARVEEAFPDTSEVGHDLQKGIFSRKSQILPALTAAIQR